MSTNNTFLAVFLGSKTSPPMKAWMALPEGERLAKQRKGIAGWKSWAEKYHAAIVDIGGPLGKTKKITQNSIEDTTNEMGAYLVLRAASAAEAARLFEGHPHFTIFPGESVEIMPILPIPSAYALANKGDDTRALQAYLGHRNIQHTVRYTELSPTRFKDFWRS